MYKTVFILTIFFACYVQIRSGPITSDDATSRLKSIIQRLHDAANEGAAKLKEVISSEYITAELHKLDRLTRSIAQKIIDAFSELLSKLKIRNRSEVNDVKRSDDSDIGLLIVTMSAESRAVMTEINRIVDEAFARGLEELKRVLNSKELNDLINKLPKRLNEYVRERIAEFAANPHSDVVSFDAARSFRDLWSRILAKHSRGNQYLEQFVISSGYLDEYNGLTTSQKNEIDELLKSLLESKQVAVSFDSPSTAQVFRDLWSRILAKHVTGRESLQAFVNSQGYRETYNSLTAEERHEIDELLNNLLGTKELPVSYDSISNARVFLDLWSRLLAKHAKGLPVLEAFVNSNGYIETYNSLTSVEKNEIDELLKNIMRKTQQK